VSVNATELRNALISSNRALNRVLTDDASLLSADGASQTITVYQIDVSTGEVLVDGLFGDLAALNDQDLLADIDSYQLDGTAAVALTEDGKTYWVALVAIDVDGTVEIHAVFGDEAADAAEVQLTEAQIRTALVAAGITDHTNYYAGVILSRIKIQRVAVDTMTFTHTDPASDDSLKNERLAGGLFGAAT
jgi:hypothetical protein